MTAAWVSETDGARCDRCVFYDRSFDEAAWGLCRCHSPRHTNDDGEGLWPNVDADDWCGEFKPTAKRLPETIPTVEVEATREVRDVFRRRRS